MINPTSLSRFKKSALRIDGEIISFTYGQMKSLEAVSKMVKKNGGLVFNSLENMAEVLNSIEREPTVIDVY